MFHSSLFSAAEYNFITSVIFYNYNKINFFVTKLSKDFIDNFILQPNTLKKERTTDILRNI